MILIYSYENNHRLIILYSLIDQHIFVIVVKLFDCGVESFCWRFFPVEIKSREPPGHQPTTHPQSTIRGKYHCSIYRSTRGRLLFLNNDPVRHRTTAPYTI